MARYVPDGVIALANVSQSVCSEVSQRLVHISCRSLVVLICLVAQPKHLPQQQHITLSDNNKNNNYHPTRVELKQADTTIHGQECAWNKPGISRLRDQETVCPEPP